MRTNTVQVEFPLVLVYLSLLTAAAALGVLFLTDSVAAYAIVGAVGFTIIMTLVARFSLAARREVERATEPGKPRPHLEVTLPEWAKRIGIGYLVLFLSAHVIGAILLVVAAIIRATE